MNLFEQIKRWILRFRYWPFLFCVAVYGAESAGPTKALMHTFLIETSKMKPYLASQEQFNSAKGQEVVGHALKILNKQLNRPTSEVQRGPGFEITFTLLKDHLQKTQEMFDQGEFEHARLRLNGTSNFCVACHAQMPQLSDSTPFGFFSENAGKTSFENAIFLFVTRRYDQALISFNELIQKYPENGLSKDQLAEVMRKKITIYARIQRDPARAIKDLDLDLKNKSLPIALQTTIKDWKKELTVWQKEKVDPATLGSDDLVQYVNKNMPTNLTRKMAPANPESLKILRLSGLLYERLYQDENLGDATPSVLYYLAISERSLSPLYWYSVSEIYLKECVVRYPKHPLAKKCFEAYRDGMTERYAGRKLPDSIQQNIKALEGYL